MKKSKFIVGLTAAFLSGVALMSCSSIIKPRSGIILTIDGVPYTAEDLFKDQKTPAAAEAKFNAVYKVAVRAYFVNGDGQKDMEEIKRETKIKISEQKSVAQSNADKNHTSYDVEWKKILDSNGVDNEKGLYDKFEYDLQKEKFENKFYEDHYDDLREGEHFSEDLTDVPFTNYLKGKQPYHIKHILVKIAGMKAGDGVNAEITRAEAQKLSDVMKRLARGDNFSEVSKDCNDDETAKENGGSLGIMSRDTSFVNDFKLGIYLYESYFGSSTKEDGGDYESIIAKTALGLDSTAIGTAGYYAKHLGASETPTPDTDEYIIDPTSKMGIGQIPFGVADRLEEYYDCDFDEGADKRIAQRFDEADLGKEDIAAKFLPRNVIFNKYFNKHNIMVITPNDTFDYVTPETGVYTGKVEYWVNGKKRTGHTDKYYGNATYTSLGGFNRPIKNNDKTPALPNQTGSSDKVLRDEHGRVILVFRSGTGGSSIANDDYQGIHFVVIERSPFIGLEYDEGDPDSGNSDDDKTTSINEYYTHYYPGQSGGQHPTYTKGEEDWKHTFVNYFNSKVQIDLKDRADTVKSELKKCDSRLDTYLYQHLCKVGNIKFNHDIVEKYKIDIEKDITDWITLTRGSKKYEDNKTWNETWKEYYYSLESQQEQREEKLEGEEATGTIHSRLIPEACAIAFTDFDEEKKFVDNPKTKLKELFGKGGIWHE